ncbi:MAG: zf-HC2 domain-containing protein [Candidatus Eremiobacteraeota bacterium]|nr:zf-HC2 domain-containing protein [Candidatus Eremiobacteraeota bacterium]
MKPTDFQKLSVKYLCGEISDRDKKMLEEHIADCEGCRKEFNEMKQACDLLEKLPAEEPAESARGKILDYAAKYRERKKKLWDYFLDFLYAHQRALRYAAAILLFLIGVMMILTHLGDMTVKPGKSPKHPATETRGSISSALDVNPDKEIEKVKREINVAWLPQISFSDSTDFYSGITPGQDGYYMPYSNSRQYREYSSIQAEMDSIEEKIKKF